MKARRLLTIIIVSIVILVLIWWLFIFKTPAQQLTETFLNQLFKVSDYNSFQDAVNNENKRITTVNLEYGGYFNDKAMNQFLADGWGTNFKYLALDNRCTIEPVSLYLQQRPSDNNNITIYNYHVTVKVRYTDTQHEKELKFDGFINVSFENGIYRLSSFSVDAFQLDQRFVDH